MQTSSPIEIFGASKDDDDEDDNNEDDMMNYSVPKSSKRHPSAGSAMPWIGESKGDEKEGEMNQKETKTTMEYSPINTLSEKKLSSTSSSSSTIQSTWSEGNDKPTLPQEYRMKVHRHHHHSMSSNEEETVLSGLLLWNHDGSIDHFDVREKTRVSE